MHCPPRARRLRLVGVDAGGLPRASLGDNGGMRKECTTHLRPGPLPSASRLARIDAQARIRDQVVYVLQFLTQNRRSYNRKTYVSTSRHRLYLGVVSFQTRPCPLLFRPCKVCPLTSERMGERRTNHAPPIHTTPPLPARRMSGGPWLCFQ